jgi:hypothetical protein
MSWTQILIEFWNLPRIWKFVQGDLEGILMWRFLLNYPGLSKDFRKIQYATPCNTSLAELISKRVLYARLIDIQPIYTSKLAKFYSCKKRVLQDPSTCLIQLPFSSDPKGSITYIGLLPPMSYLPCNLRSHPTFISIPTLSTISLNGDDFFQKSTHVVSCQQTQIDH